jgi:uncharacterized protein
MDTTIPDPAFVLQVLRANQDDIARLGVKSLAIFGSVARKEASPSSDVDILVEFSRPVGLVTPDAIRPAMKERIISEAIYA